MKPFLAFAQETEDMRTVTIVSNPGTENEKTESIQVPKGLQVSIGSDWDVEETFSVYEDAACTQPSEEMWDVNADITIYVKWDEIRYTVTPEEWDAAVVENNFTVERIEGGETVTIQKYTDYALDVDGNFKVTSGSAPLIATQPVETIDIDATASSVSSATIYFVPAYDYKGFTIDGSAVTPTGSVDADGVTLYKAVLSTGAITITKVGFQETQEGFQSLNRTFIPINSLDAEKKADKREIGANMEGNS